MACPYFYPIKPLADSWRPVHLPLGEPYGGECRAAAEPYHPDGEQLRTLCNLGYGRKRCPHFAGGADAARFLIVRDTDSRITVSYVLERDHLPDEHGRLEYNTRSACFDPVHPNPNIQRQAAVYLEAYLRRKDNPCFRGPASAGRRKTADAT